MSLFDSIKPAGSTTTPSSGGLFSNIGKTTTVTPPAAQPKSPYFSAVDKSGNSYGFSDETDPSGLPYFAYRNPGDTATTTDKTRVAFRVDPRVATTTSTFLRATPRDVAGEANQRILTDAGPNEQIDHQMALGVGGSNNPLNLKKVPKAQNQGASHLEGDLSNEIDNGNISMFNAQIQEANAKGLPLPWTGQKTNAQAAASYVTAIKNGLGHAGMLVYNTLSHAFEDAKPPVKPVVPADQTTTVPPSTGLFSKIKANNVDLSKPGLSISNPSFGISKSTQAVGDDQTPNITPESVAKAGFNYEKDFLTGPANTTGGTVRNTIVDLLTGVKSKEKVLQSFGQGSFRGFAAVASALTQKPFTPQGQFQKDLFGTDKPIDLNSFGRETRLADPQGKSTGIFKTIDPKLGLVAGIADAIPGLEDISGLLGLTNDVRRAIAETDDAAHISRLLQEEIPNLKPDTADTLGNIFKHINNEAAVNTAINRINFEVNSPKPTDAPIETLPENATPASEQTPETTPPAPASSVAESSPIYNANTQSPTFEGFNDVTTNILDKLQGRSSVSKQFISDLTNGGDLKQAEREVVRTALESYPDGSQVPVQEFADKVKAELLPLTRDTGSLSEGYIPRYENVSLPDNLKGKVSDYSENVYESPIKTSAGAVHFPNRTDNYFGHTRIEDIPGNTRRVIEVQSDLYQKGNLEKEVDNKSAMKIDEKSGLPKYNARANEVDKLRQYTNPTAHFRMVREELKQAAIDGKTAVQFPTGETAMKIEGLGNATIWADPKDTNHIVQPSELKAGKEIVESRVNNIHPGGDEVLGTHWIITDVLGDGKFKAVKRDDIIPDGFLKITANQSGKEVLDQFLRKSAKVDGYTPADFDRIKETFDISGKIDTNNPIYKFYEKDLGRYLTSKFGAKVITDKQGVNWYEVPTNKDLATKGVSAFGEQKPGYKAISEIKEAKPYEKFDNYNRTTDSSALKLKFRRRGYLKLPNVRIGSPADVAFAFDFLRNNVAESFYVVGLKDDKPISVELISIGTINSSLVDPYAVSPLLRAKGADGVYLVHNHPSGDVRASQQDIDAQYRLTESLKDFGIGIKGQVIIDTDKYGFITPSGDAKVIPLPDDEIVRKGKTPIFEKYQQWQDKNIGPAIADSGDAVNLMKGLTVDWKNNSVAFLLNTQLNVNSTIILPNTLARGDIQKLALKLVTAAQDSVSTSIVLGNLPISQFDFKKLSDILSEKHNITLQDAVIMDGSSYKSVQAGGPVKGVDTTSKISEDQPKSEIDSLIEAGKIQVVSADGKDVYQYKRAGEWVNARDEDSAINHVSPKPKVIDPALERLQTRLNIKREIVKNSPFNSPNNNLFFDREGRTRELGDIKNPDLIRKMEDRMAENGIEDPQQFTEGLDEFMQARRDVKNAEKEISDYKIAARKKELGQLLPANAVSLSDTPMEEGEATSLETAAHQLQEEANPAVSGQNFSLPAIIKQSLTPVKSKVGILDYMRTPEKVLEKIGLGPEAEFLRKQYEGYLKELPENIDKITRWAERAPGSSNRLFKYLDGQAISLTPQEKEIALEIKAWLSEWADRLGLPEDQRIARYITRIFDDQLAEKEFDEDLAKIIRDKIPGSVYDPFLQKRLGARGYREEVWPALDAYVKRATRKVYMDPALERIKDKAASFEESQWDYIKKYTDALNMRPTAMDNLIDNSIKQLIGYKFGGRPLMRLTSTLRRIQSRGLLGLNLSTALRNLSQGANTYAVLGEKYTALGYLKLFSSGALQELKENHVLGSSFIQDRVISSTKKAAQQMDKTLFYFIEQGERINRGAAYFGAKAKYISEHTKNLQGVTVIPEDLEKDAIAYAKKVVRQTQFAFGSIDSPVGMSSDIMKTVLELGSYTTKQIEFLADLAKNKNWIGLLRYALFGALFTYTIGKAFNMTLKDLIPAYRIGLPPSLKFPGAVAGAIMNTPDKYGATRSISKKAEDVGAAAFGLVPASGQIKKTYTGAKAIFSGGTQAKSGKTLFKAPETILGDAQALLFGANSTQEAQDYFNGTSAAQTAYDKIKKSPSPAAAFDDLATKDPALAKQVAAIEADVQKGITPDDKKILQLGVANGDRAKYIVAQFNKLKTIKEKEDLWQQYTAKKIITVSVAAQITSLLARQDK